MQAVRQRGGECVGVVRGRVRVEREGRRWRGRGGDVNGGGEGSSGVGLREEQGDGGQEGFSR